MARQLARFAGVGVASTLAYLVLYLLLRSVAGAQAANLLALLVTAVANTAANRRLTFGVTGRDGAGRHQLEGLVVFAVGLGLTSGALGTLHALSDSPGTLLELGVLVLANATATVVRFLLLRAWVFHPGRATRIRTNRTNATATGTHDHDTRPTEPVQPGHHAL
jgi:putative flippase GtrA